MADNDPNKYLKSEKAQDLLKWKHRTNNSSEVERKQDWHIFDNWNAEKEKLINNKEDTAPTSLPDPSPVQCGGPSVPGPAQPLPQPAQPLSGPAQPLPGPAQPLPGPDPSLTARSRISGTSSKGPGRKRKVNENNVEANKMQLRSIINRTKSPSKTQETNLIKKTSSTTIGGPSNTNVFQEPNDPPNETPEINENKKILTYSYIQNYSHCTWNDESSSNF